MAQWERREDNKPMVVGSIPTEDSWTTVFFFFAIGGFSKKSDGGFDETPGTVHESVGGPGKSTGYVNPCIFKLNTFSKNLPPLLFPMLSP